MNGKKSRLSHDPIFKVEGGELKDTTALETGVGKGLKISMYTLFAGYGFFLVCVGVVSDLVEINFGFIGAFMLSDTVKYIYFAVRLITAVMVAIFIIFIFKADRKYEVTQWEGMGLLRSITFACIMISVVVVDVTVILDASGNDWVIQFWKDGVLLLRASALIDLCIVLPATILSIITMVVQIIKTTKKSGVELLYNSFGDLDERVYIDSTVKRMKCVDTDKGTICKVTGTMNSKEFVSG